MANHSSRGLAGQVGPDAPAPPSAGLGLGQPSSPVLLSAETLIVFAPAQLRLPIGPSQPLQCQLFPLSGKVFLCFSAQIPKRGDPNCRRSFLESCHMGPKGHLLNQGLAAVV